MVLRLKQLLFWLHRAEELLLLLVFMAMLLLAVLQILLRNALGISWSWIDPAARASLLWIAMLAGIIASRRGSHLRINLIEHYLPANLSAMLMRFIGLCAGMFLWFLAWHSWRLVAEERLFADLAFAQVQVWQVMLILPIGFGLMGWRHLLQVIWPYRPKEPF